MDWDKVHAANPHGMVAGCGTALAKGLTGDALAAMRPNGLILSPASRRSLLAGFSLTLPHTPPKKVGEGGAEKFAWLEAMKLLRHPFVLVLWVVTFLDAFVLYCYFNWTGSSWAHPGSGRRRHSRQLDYAGDERRADCRDAHDVHPRRDPEAARLARATMVIGILGISAALRRLGIFRRRTPARSFVVQILHGVCYAFFFATVYIFVEEYFPKDVRASAQGLFNVMILGIGVLVANSICPKLAQETFLRNGATDFHHLFLVPLTVALLSAAALALFFWPPRGREGTSGR